MNPHDTGNIVRQTDRLLMPDVERSTFDAFRSHIGVPNRYIYLGPGEPPEVDRPYSPYGVFGYPLLGAIAQRVERLGSSKPYAIFELCEEAVDRVVVLDGHGVPVNYTPEHFVNHIALLKRAMPHLCDEVDVCCNRLHGSHHHFFVLYLCCRDLGVFQSGYAGQNWRDMLSSVGLSGVLDMSGRIFGQTPEPHALFFKPVDINVLERYAP